VVEYRPPQKTALHIDGSDVPFRVALPGLMMIRTTTSGDHPKYSIFAVKDRPTTFQAPLFLAPLPNVYADGAVCWGSVQKVSVEALAGSNLAEDWRMLLGSLFTAHSVSGKSRSQPQDIRKKLTELDARKSPCLPEAGSCSHENDVSRCTQQISRKDRSIMQQAARFDPPQMIRDVVLVGCGGTGSALARSLCRIVYDLNHRRNTRLRSNLSTRIGWR